MNDLIPDNFRGDEELIRLTIRQIKKDLGNVAGDFHFSGVKEKLFEELAVRITELLTPVRKSNPALFKVILYRVDINERDVREALSHESIYRLAEKIIQREFQKVLTRRFFS